MRGFASIAVLAASLTACSFSVQMAITGRDSGGEWFAVSSEKCSGAFNGYLGGRNILFDRSEQYGGHSVFALVTLPLDTSDDNASGNFRIVPAMSDYGTWIATGVAIDISPSEAESRAIGDFELAYGSVVWSNCVFTARGNPYSLILNNTSTPRTINGVSIGAFEGKRLLFPLVMYMDYDPALSFFDLSNGVSVATGGYSNGRYSPMWCGDIELRDGSRRPGIPLATNINPIIFADMNVGSNVGKPLYADSGKLVFANMFPLTTNVSLNTWWDFTQEEWDGDSMPKAKINSKSVCDGHTTDHIIPYTVNDDRIHVSEMSGVGSFTFTMSQEPGANASGGPCTFKCWDRNHGSNEEGYNSTPAEHKAAIAGGVGTVAVFKVTFNIYTGEWKVEPAN